MLQTDVYLTGEDGSRELARSEAPSEPEPPVQLGRPDLQQLFADTVETATAHRESRVAVCFCGPPGMQDTVRTLCSSASGPRVALDFHAEEFEL